MDAVPEFCRDSARVNREAVHDKTAAMAIAFFDRVLRPSQTDAVTVVRMRSPRASAALPVSVPSTGKSLR